VGKAGGYTSPVNSSPISRLVQQVVEDDTGLAAFLAKSSYARVSPDDEICDFVFGNPHDMPLPEYEEALRKWTYAKSPDWFAYKVSEESAKEAVAKSLVDRFGIAFEPNDIAMTTGAFAGLPVTLRAVVDPGDEVIYLSPPWISYAGIIRSVVAEPVRVKLQPPFDLDVEGIRRAITSRTRAVIINSPHNPTGRIYQRPELAALSKILTEASQSNDRKIYLLSDEAYSRIIYDDREFMTPTAFYPASFLIYTYGKTLLSPGERIGYIAVPPEAPDRWSLRMALFQSQVVTGWAFPNAVLQYAIEDLNKLSVDIKRLQSRRDRMVERLREIGYEVNIPEATFYLMAKSPITDDEAFAEVLAESKVFVLPGSLVEMPGYFRISLTASDDMIERSFEGFARALQSA
jgi:aspartate aminotransferase